MTQRSKRLETAIRQMLDANGYAYVSSKNQTVKCYKCQSFQKVRTQGFDFLVYHPIVFYCEAKTGSGRMTISQKETRESAERRGIPYVVCRDTVDELIKFLGRGRNDVKTDK